MKFCHSCSKAVLDAVVSCIVTVSVFLRLLLEGSRNSKRARIRTVIKINATFSGAHQRGNLHPYLTIEDFMPTILHDRGKSTIISKL